MPKYTLAATAIAALIVASAAATHAASTEKSGNFRNAGGHTTSGSVKLVKDGSRWKVVMGSNFRHDGAPAPRVAFGNGKYVRGTIISKLRKNRGAQTYIVPKRLNPGKFTQVWIWCAKFNSPLGVAEIR